MVDESKLIERQKTSELIFDGRVLHLYRDEVTLPDGREMMLKGGSYTFMTEAED